jgi:hypothetical protein
MLIKKGMENSIMNNNKKPSDNIFEDVLAALYDQDVAYTKLKRTCTEILKVGGVRE